MINFSTPHPFPLPLLHMYVFGVALIPLSTLSVNDFINLIAPVLTLLICHSFLILVYCRNS